MAPDVSRTSDNKNRHRLPGGSSLSDGSFSYSRIRILLSLLAVPHSSERESGSYPSQQPFRRDVERQVQLRRFRHGFARLSVLSGLQIPIGPSAVDRAQLLPNELPTFAGRPSLKRKSPSSRSWLS